MAARTAALSAAFLCITNPTLVTTSRCPSSLGPGLHTVRLDVPSEGTVYARAFDVYVAASQPLRQRRPVVVMWHGCGSDPEKFQEESEMNQRAADARYYAVWPRGSSSSLAPGEQLARRA